MNIVIVGTKPIEVKSGGIGFAHSVYSTVNGKIVKRMASLVFREGLLDEDNIEDFRKHPADFVDAVLKDAKENKKEK